MARLKQFWKDCKHRKGSVLRNVADLADPPKLSAAPKWEMRVWTADDLRTFLTEIEGHRLHPAFFIAAAVRSRVAFTRASFPP